MILPPQKSKAHLPACKCRVASSELKYKIAIISVEGLPVNAAADAKLKSVGEVVRVDSRDPHLIEKVSDVDAILVRSAEITRELIESARKLKIIACQLVGVDKIDVAAAEKAHITITCAPVGNVSSVAEHVICLMLALARNILRINSMVKEGKWKPRWRLDEIESQPPTLLLDKTLGIIGLGNVGTRVAKRAAAFEMNLLAHDPYIHMERFQEAGAKSVDLDTLLRDSDIVTVHVPLTSLTRHLIDERKLKLMKRDALLINTSRGAVVDEKALYHALKSRIIRGAALDVREKEPSEANDPFYQLDNVILTPHMASVSDQTLIRMSETAAEDIIRVLRNEKPLHRYVTQAIPYPL